VPMLGAMVESATGLNVRDLIARTPSNGHGDIPLVRTIDPDGASTTAVVGAAEPEAQAGKGTAPEKATPERQTPNGTTPVENPPEV
jgi:hypothetical protein